jgi:hypothetical protein
MVETGPGGLVAVELQPVGRRVQVAPGVTVLAAAQAAGIELVSVWRRGGHLWHPSRASGRWLAQW